MPTAPPAPRQQLQRMEHRVLGSRVWFGADGTLLRAADPIDPTPLRANPPIFASEEDPRVFISSRANFGVSADLAESVDGW